jgi:hypothetical protein
VGERISAPAQTGPEAHHNGYGVSFPGVKRPGRGVDHPPHLAFRLKKEYSGHSWPVIGRTLLYK